MGWRAVSWCHCPSRQGTGSTDIPRTYLPLPISGVAVQDSFPHQPHNFRTSSLFPSPKDGEVGLTVTSSPLQQVEQKPS